MRKLSLILLIFITFGVSAKADYTKFYTRANQLDINRAAYEDVIKLPITQEQAEVLYERVRYGEYLTSIYQIRTLPGFDQATFDLIKPLIMITPFIGYNPEIERMNNIYYRISDWASSEGTNENLVNLWIDLARNPLFINEADYTDLINLQNVSPQDALAVSQAIERRGSINSRGELRTVPGLTGWGYRNIRNFVVYEKPSDKRELKGDYQVRVFTRRLDDDTQDILYENLNPGDAEANSVDYKSYYYDLYQESPAPAVASKLRLRYGNDFVGGWILHRNLGEYDASLWNNKFYAGVLKKDLGPIHLRSFYVGNYLISFGQGIVMENLDYFKPRKSGFSWDKRITGVIGDISESHEFTLRGFAGQTVYKDKLDFTFFYSSDKKDAILNDDGTISTYINMSPRVTNEELNANGFNSMIDVLHEQTYGGNLQYNIIPGSYVAASYYESLYDNKFVPKFTTISDRSDKQVAMDSEFLSGYDVDGKYRRVYGWNFQTIFNRLSIQGEYAELEKNGSYFKIGDDPKGAVMSAFLQFDRTHLLLLYRHYDVDFDNPYNRGFSNYEKYKGSIFEDEFYLKNPFHGFVYDNSVIPQSEDGLYLEWRYQMTRGFTSVVEFDTWKRLADNANYQRIVLKLYYRPIYPIVLRLRQKFQSRDPGNILNKTRFDNVTSRFHFSFRLSRYDDLSLLYFTGKTSWPPRPRLIDNPDYGDGQPILGNSASPNEAFGAYLEHNFSDYFSGSLGFLVYDGFYWGFEDNEFFVTDGEATRYYIAINDRLTDRLSIRFKYTIDDTRPRTYIDARYYNDDRRDRDPIEPDAYNVHKVYHFYRLQLDFSW
ncbi:MAG: hypothetical protein GY855_17080 [candidate division Zixibacteria bacterium]|nr:hypothetical protein [candidate division Zixibacteria bacterium]